MTHESSVPGNFQLILKNHHPPAQFSADSRLN